jgi:hypothetical protein
LKTRYIEDDSGRALVCLHGGSLGSPELDLHIGDNCKHLMRWDGTEQFDKWAASFLPN